MIINDHFLYKGTLIFNKICKIDLIRIAYLGGISLHFKDEIVKWCQSVFILVHYVERKGCWYYEVLAQACQTWITWWAAQGVGKVK